MSEPTKAVPAEKLSADNGWNDRRDVPAARLYKPMPENFKLPKGYNF